MERIVGIITDCGLVRLHGMILGIMVGVVLVGNRWLGFMFQLTWEETETVGSQWVTLNPEQPESSRSQFVTLKRGGNPKYRPYAFTQEGVAMLSSVLRGERAVLVNIEIMRTFVRLRQMLAANAELARRLDTLEKKYDSQFRIVFDAIRELMAPPPPRRQQRIGFT
jgi:hypothetical protein